MMKRKWIFFLALVMSTSAYSLAGMTDIFFFDWKKDISIEEKYDVIKTLSDLGIKIDNDSWMLKLTKDQKKFVLELGAFAYLEKDGLEQIIKPINRPDEVIINSNSTEWYKDWHLKRISVEQAWKITKGSSKVVVAVCDSGIASDHRELSGKILKGWNFIDGDDDTSPNTNHGTAVSGFIAASDINNYGAYGVAPNISILPGKIVTTSGGVPTSAMLSCIRWAAKKGAKVINVSMTGVNSNSSASAARYANSKGAIVVWAAGNQNYIRRSWRDRPEIIAVGGTDIDDNRYHAVVTRDGRTKHYGSNRGPFVDIAAPGEDLFTMRANGSFGRSNGTSYSAPLVSGVAALIFSVNPNLSPEQVTKILKSSATSMKDTNAFGSGIVNTEKALKLAQKTL